MQAEGCIGAGFDTRRLHHTVGLTIQPISGLAASIQSEKARKA